VAIRPLEDFERSSRAGRRSLLLCGIRTAKVFPRGSKGKTSQGEGGRGSYGLGDVSAGDSVVPAGDSVVVAGLAVSVVVVVVGGAVAAGLAAGSVVSVFCSHAARSAALARMQMYFFIVVVERAYWFN